MNRRSFVARTAGTFAAGMISQAAFSFPAGNKLPKWRGFNLLDFFSPDPANQRTPTTDDHLKWMRDWGFDFVRIPIAYPAYLDIDRTKNITVEDTYKIDYKQIDKIDSLIIRALQHGLHVSINLHRAPGYCVNAGFNEPFNLWKDQAAQDAFYFHWNMWAELYGSESKSRVSFDLVNEPSMREDMNDQHSKRSTVPATYIAKL